VSIYLVTGGAGFIGSHLVEALVTRGETVRVLDNFVSGKRENLAPWRDRITLIEGDIRDRAKVTETVRGVDYVLHQAALRSVPKSMAHPEEYHEVNVSGLLTVLQAARAAKVKRFVLASSSSVYGEATRFPQSEEQPARPISVYGATKLAGEHYCHVFATGLGLETVALRYFNVFGPRQSLENEYAVVVPKFITALLRGEPTPIYGDGTQSRDFTFIENVIRANLLACTAPSVSGRVFNVGCGASHTVLDLASRLNRLLGKEIPPVFQPPRPGDVPKTQADISSAQAHLGYRVQVSFDAGLQRTAAWFQTAPSPAAA